MQLRERLDRLEKSHDEFAEIFNINTRALQAAIQELEIRILTIQLLVAASPEDLASYRVKAITKLKSDIEKATEDAKLKSPATKTEDAVTVFGGDNG